MTSSFLPWIRKYNYIEDYHKTAYDLWARVYPAYPITYYQFDKVNSTYENRYLLGGSYEKEGVGELSGYVFKKILLLPVYGIEQIQPMQSSGERGMTYDDSLTSSIAFPSVYNLTPTEGDIVDINAGYHSDVINQYPLFSITNVNLAHHGPDYNIFSCRIKASPFDLHQLEEQVDSRYMFVEHEKKIYPIDNAENMLKILEKSYTIMKTLLPNFYYKSIGFYLSDQNNNC